MRLVLLKQWLRAVFSNTVNRKKTEMIEPTILDNGTVIAQPRKPHAYSMGFGMAFVTSNNVQVASFVSCRDYMQDQLRTFHNDNKRVSDDAHPYYPDQGDPDPITSRLRLLLSIDTRDIEKFTHAMTVLNSLEAYGGMELTVAERVNATKTDADYFLLRGSGEYMNNPHLLSLVTLVMRFCFYNNKFTVKDELCLKDNYKKINPSKDNHLMCDCYQMMHEIMNQREELFKDMTIPELFPPGIKYNFHSQGGIQQLCKGNTPNKKVNDRIFKLRKKLKIK